MLTMAASDYEYPDNVDALQMPAVRGDDNSFDDREDDQTNSLEYDILLQEAIDSDLRETELTGDAQETILECDERESLHSHSAMNRRDKGSRGSKEGKRRG